MASQSGVAFELMDANGDGVISRDEFKKAFEASAALRTVQEKPFPTHWGSPPFNQEKDTVVWPGGFGTGSSTVGDWISDNLFRDSTLGRPTSRLLKEEKLMEDSDTSTQCLTTYLAKQRAELNHALESARLAAESARQAKFDEAMPDDHMGSQRQQVWPSQQSWHRQGPFVGATGGYRAAPPRRGLDLDSARFDAAQATAAAAAACRNASYPSYRAQSPPRSPRTYLPSPKSRGGLAARMAAATAYNQQALLAEQELLFEELRLTVTNQVAFLSCVLHNWRLVTAVAKALAQAQLRFEQDLAEEKASAQKMHEKAFAQLKAKQKEYVQQQQDKILNTWKMEDSNGLVQACLLSWRKETMEESMRRLANTHMQTAGSVISRFAAAETQGLLQMVLNFWREANAEAQRATGSQRVLERTALKWFSDQANGLLQAILAAWQQRSRATSRVLTHFAKGNSRALLSTSLRAWVDAWRLSKEMQKPKDAIVKMGFRWMAQKNSELLRAVFQTWENETTNRQAMEREEKRYRDFMKEHEASLREAQAEREAAKAAAKAKEANAVQIILRKWELGAKHGVLQQIWTTWSNYSKDQAIIARQKQGVQATTQRWIEGQLRGSISLCFENWRADIYNAKRVREQAEKLRNDEEKFQRLLRDERAEHQRALQAQKTAAQQKAEQLNKVLGFSLTSCMKGDAHGLTHEIFKAWAAEADAHKKVAAKRAAVRSALMKTIAGEERGLVQLAFNNWKTDILNEKNASEARAVKQQMMVKWFMGESAGLLKSAFAEWHAMRVKRHQQEATHLAVMKVIVGEQTALLQGVLNAWHMHSKISKSIAEASSEHASELKRLQAEHAALLAKSQEQSSHYMSIMATSFGGSNEASQKIFVATVLSNWRSYVKDQKTAELGRQLKVEEQEREARKRLDEAQSRSRTAKVLNRMGNAGGTALQAEVFLLWSVFQQESSAEKRNKMKVNQTVGVMGAHIARERLKKDVDALLSLCLWEMLNIARQQRHEREQNGVAGKLEEAMASINRFEREKRLLEEQVLMSYKEIEHITHTLQKELRLKEELAAELREAYSKLRRSNCPSRTLSTETPRLQIAEGFPLTEFASFGSSPRFTSSTKSPRLGMPALPAPAPKPSKTLPSADKIFDELDVNGDGVISREEFEKALTTEWDIRSTSSTSCPSPLKPLVAAEPGEVDIGSSRFPTH